MTFSIKDRAALPVGELRMVQEMTPVRRRLVAHGKMARRKRIFARLREGASYEEIGSEEGVSRERIRQIVAEVLQKRAVDSGAEHAKLQLDRLPPLMQLAAEAVAAGDIRAITPYLKVLDRLDRYQTVASANHAYDDEARKKIMNKINRIAANYGIDEAFEAAVKEHLKKQGVVLDGESGEADPVDDPASPAGEQREGQSEAADWMSA